MSTILNIPEIDGGVEVLAASRPSPFAFRAKMAVNADGAARAYHPADTGLDYLANAGRPGNWWALVTHNGRRDGRPVVQSAADPAPGYYVSTTALTDPSVTNPRKPSKYVDSAEIPFVVLPAGGGNGARLGDFATVVHLESWKICHAIHADIGPRGKYGEGSIALAEAMGLPSSPRHGGTDRRIIAYIFYPLSGNGRPRPVEVIREEGERLFQEWGGMTRVREMFARTAEGNEEAVTESAFGHAAGNGTLEDIVREAEENLDLRTLQTLQDRLIEHSVIQEVEGEMLPRVVPQATPELSRALGLAAGAESAEAAGWLDALNVVIDAQRRVRFRLDKAARPHLPVIVGEGDSWFLHPLLHDVLDHLRETHYNVRSLAAAGDTVENMLGSDTWLEQLVSEGADALVFSGGGNDFLGGGRVAAMVHPEDPSKLPAQLVVSDEVDRLLDRMASLYIRMLRRLRAELPGVRVFAHGYDYVVRVEKGPWIWPYLQRKGYNPERAAAVTSVLLDRFNRRMELIQASEGNFRYLNMLGVVGTSPAEWDDAIHPKREGFRRVAEKFHDALTGFLGGSRRERAEALPEETLVEADSLEYDPAPDVDERSELDGPCVLEPASRPRIGPGDVGWVRNFARNPDYAHLPPGAEGASFQLSAALLEQALSLGFYQPHFTAEGHLIVAIRGASIQGGMDSVIRGRTVTLVEQKPDHRRFRCLTAVWHRNEGLVSVFRASTVPNRGGVASAYNLYNGYGGTAANMLPTGCYRLCVGTHYGSATIPTVLRLGSGPEPAQALEVTTLRSRNDGVYDLEDFWDRCRPADNIHPAFSAGSADFSSLGCLTIPGSYSAGEHRGLWARFRETAGFDSNVHRGTRYDLLLTTGMELAAIAMGGSGLRRLSHGSVGPQVTALQRALGLASPDGVFGAATKRSLAGAETAAGGGATGIYSLRTQGVLGFAVLA